MNDIATPAPPPEAPPQVPCRNCGAPLLGGHCYACGQPVKGLVRPLGNLFGDLLDSVFNVDTRILRTIPPLFAKPGFLTNEYFAGRQVRYVTPVRLFFFLCIMAFFLARLSIDEGSNPINVNLNDPVAGEIGAATTEADVITRRDAAVKRLTEARAKIPETPGKAGAEVGFDAQIDQASRNADIRLKQLREAAASGATPPPPMEDTFSIGNNGVWDEKKNPVHLPGAPKFVDGWFNQKIGRAKHNITRIKAEPGQYIDAFVGAIPTALLVLVPLFALMLKLAFVFKRRLYMEHLVVSLHSHAFLSLDLLLVFACLASQRLVASGSVIDGILDWCVGLLIAWMPIYLLLMQKRVYGQGWPMTLLKYLVLGTCYMTLLGFAISAAAIASLVWM